MRKARDTRPQVHIFATCRKRDLLPQSILVFDTIRVGFPNARILVHRGRMVGGVDELTAAISRVGAEVNNRFSRISFAPHYEWIEKLAMNLQQPFWICDTDMIFHDEVEHWEFDQPLAGKFVPAFNDKFTRRTTHSRLHTALMYFDPQRLRHMMGRVNAITPEHPHKTPISFFAPIYYSLRNSSGVPRHYFFDDCAMLYHCCGGQPFTDRQKDAYTHLHCGTYVDLVEPYYENLRSEHAMAMANPAAMRGSWRAEEEYIAALSPDRKPRIDPNQLAFCP